MVDHSYANAWHVCFDLLHFTFTAAISVQGNDLRGSLDKLCNVKDDRRVQFDSYLTLAVEADCHGDPPKVDCKCCTACL